MSNSISSRIKVLINHVAPNMSQFCKETGLGYSTINQIVNKDRSPGWEVISAIVSKYDTISLEWLIKGHGDIEGSAPENLHEMQFKIMQLEAELESQTAKANKYETFIREKVVMDKTKLF